MIVQWPVPGLGLRSFDTEYVTQVRAYWYSSKTWIVDVWLVGLPEPLRRYARCEVKNVRPDAAINEVYELIGWPIPNTGATS